MNEKTLDPKLFILNRIFSSVILCELKCWKLLFVYWIIREVNLLLLSLAVFRFSIFLLNIIHILIKILFNEYPVLEFCVSVIIDAKLEVPYKILNCYFRCNINCKSTWIANINILIKIFTLFIVVKPLP